MKRFPTNFVGVLPYIFVFIASLYTQTDPDLGWHLKYGEYFFQHHQILRENIYSTMMPGYQWANGSWGTDILTYLIFSAGEFLGLTIASALIVTLTFFFFAKAASVTLFEKAVFFPVFVYLLTPVNMYSFRGEIISLLFIGLLFFILSKYKEKGKTFSKRLWYIPVLFFFWVNLQTESMLGLAIFGMWVSVVILQAFYKKGKLLSPDNRFLIKIFFITLFVTFPNPFGLHIHQVAFSHFGDPMLQKIREYISFTMFSYQWWNQIFALVFLLGVTIFLLRKGKLNEHLPFLVPLMFLLLLAFEVKRFSWPAYYFMMPFLHLVGKLVEKKIKKYTFYLAYVISLISIAWIGYHKLPVSQFTEMTWRSYCETNYTFCSPESAQFLLDHNLTKNVFSIYDWGGFLIWNYPEIKPSIDGRMHMWRDDKGNSAYAEYDDYMHGLKNIDDSPYDVVYFRMDKTVALYQEMLHLSKEKKWQLVYNDGLVGVVVRVKKYVIR